MSLIVECKDWQLSTYPRRKLLAVFPEPLVRCRYSLASRVMPEP